MDNKYYTPDMSEFYIGFEYEHLIDGVWKQVIVEDSEHLTYLMFDSNDKNWRNSCNDVIRVKYLDRGDVESLGFICTSEYNNGEEKEFQKFINEEDNWLLEMSFDHRVIITFEKGFGETTDFVNFDGYIKNKSELKKLLIQLGI